MSLKREVACERYKSVELPRKSNSWSDSASKPCAKEPIGWPTDFTPWLSTWRVEQLPKLLMSLKFIALTYACGWSAGNKMGWRESWRDTALAVRRLSLNANASS
jgi:hypothetical protein